MKKEYLIMTIAILLLASGHPIGKIILTQVSSLQLATVSTVLAATVIWVGLAATGQANELLRYSRRDVYLTMACGLLYFTLYPIMTFSALAIIPPAVNALLIGTSPIMVTIIVVTTARGRLKALGYLGVALGFLGVIVVLLGGGVNSALAEGLLSVGPLFSIAGAVFSSVNTILGRSLMQRHGPLPTVGLASALGAIILTLVTSGTMGFDAVFGASLVVKGLIAYWGIFSGLGSLLFYYCLKNLEAPRAAAFVYFSPAFAAILSFFILGEPITIALAAGLVLVFIGVSLAQR
jgi:drug/metabolite transporter (DMT)-like permease